MRERIKLFLSYGIFWLTFFVAARILFLTYHYDKTTALAFVDVLLSILHGFRLDLSTTGYFLLLPGLVLIATSFFRTRFLRIFFDVYTTALLIACSFVIIFDLEMYTHWGFRLDATPLLYIGKDTPLAIGPWVVGSLVLLWVLLLAVFAFAYKQLLAPKINAIPKSNWTTALVMLLLTGLMIAPIRGTVGVAPINTGVVFFHPTNLYANHAAINPVWNSGYALSKYGRLKYPENYLDPKKTTQYFSELYHSAGPTEQLLQTDRPNIIIIIMESYTFRFIEPLGGMKGVAPNLNKLAAEGVLFTNMYASGDRTDKGLVSILSGYPSQPVSSIIKYPKKTQSLPFLNKNFKQLGYKTAFTYGGNIDFANFRSYLSNAQFDDITHSGDFPDSLNTSKWGVHDAHVFNKFLKETNNTKEPFFKMMLTLSSHEPFEVPMESIFEGDDDQTKFLNAAYYADQSLGQFIREAKKTDWWDNTLVVITADHGHAMFGNNGVANPDRFKIPMLWVGGALAAKDTTIATFVNQTDMANTLLGQMKVPDPAFKFSKNVLQESQRDFAVYIYNNGFGFIDKDHHVVYDNTGKKYMVEKGVRDERDLDLGKAYMQTLYNDFNSR